MSTVSHEVSGTLHLSQLELLLQLVQVTVFHFCLCFHDKCGLRHPCQYGHYCLQQQEGHYA